MIDVPKISQRSIIAFCDCSYVGDNTTNHVWVKAATRAPLTVSSLTTSTLKVNGGDDAVISAAGTEQGIKVVASGSGVDVYAWLNWTGYPYVSYGYDDRASFTLTVTTAGDVQRGIEGTTREFQINVLMLGRDWPHPDTEVLFFRVGKKVDYTFRFVNQAREWDHIGVQTGFPYGDGGGGGHAQLVSNVKVSGNYAPSGLEVIGEEAVNGDKVVRLYGTAIRPGIYRVEFDLESKEDSSHVSVVHPFKSGRCTTVVCVCVYEPYQPGNVVVLLPAPAAFPPCDLLRTTHAPFLSGYGEFLTGQNFTHYKTETYEHWSAVVAQEGGSGSISQYWYFRVRKTVQYWGLVGYLIQRRPGIDPPSGYVDPDAFAAMTHAQIVARAREYAGLAIADIRNFLDEQPPKQGWRSYVESDPATVQYQVTATRASAGGTYSGSATVQDEGGGGSGSGGEQTLLYYYRYIPATDAETDDAYYEVWCFVFTGTHADAELDALGFDALKELSDCISVTQLDNVTILPGEVANNG